MSAFSKIGITRVYADVWKSEDGLYYIKVNIYLRDREGKVDRHCFPSMDYLNIPEEGDLMWYSDIHDAFSNYTSMPDREVYCGNLTSYDTECPHESLILSIKNGMPDKVYIFLYGNRYTLNLTNEYYEGKLYYNGEAPKYTDNDYY